MSTLNEAITQVTDQPTQEFMPDPEVRVGAGSSVLAAVRARAEQLSHENTVELDVPGYDGVLVGRYKAISIARVFNGPAGSMRNPLTDWGPGADALGQALIGLYGRNDDGELEPLFLDQAARFDDDLVDALKLKPVKKSARAVLVALCGGGELGESRVWSLYMNYQNWLTEGAAQEVADESVGES